jgi:hypothetical protein
VGEGIDSSVNRYDAQEDQTDRCWLVWEIVQSLLIAGVLLAGVAAGMLLVGAWRW